MGDTDGESDAADQDADDSADAEPDSDADTSDGAAHDGAAADAAASDAAFVGAEILSPRPGALFCTFEDVPLRGVCRGGAGEAAPSATFVVRTEGQAWSAKGSDVRHRFERAGSYTLELTCLDARGHEEQATLSLKVLAPPSVTFTARAPGATSDAMFATRLDQLGQATQISPRSEALAAKITALDCTGSI